MKYSVYIRASIYMIMTNMDFGPGEMCNKLIGFLNGVEIDCEVIDILYDIIRNECRFNVREFPILYYYLWLMTGRVGNLFNFLYFCEIDCEELVFRVRFEYGDYINYDYSMKSIRFEKFRNRYEIVQMFE